jgi:FtsP/CotA-like multicopper oxidase with cupredoxin domain
VFTRRQLLTTGALSGAALLASPALLSRSSAVTPAAALDPTTITKYVTPLFIMSKMPPASTAGGIDTYEIAARRFQQQMLPAGLGSTAVFGYGCPGQAGTFHVPSRTIEASVNRPVRVSWINQLTTAQGGYLPHLFAVDPTLHWANPPGGVAGRDSRPLFTSTPGPYTGPVPIVTHLHGGHSFEDSDGYPEAWTLPAANDIPSGYASVGSYHDQFMAEFTARVGIGWPAGTAVSQYSNDQPATALWFHDHALGMTRLNVHAGLAGLYLLRGGAMDLPAGVLPSGRYEIPLAIQDRSFNTDGSPSFPTTRDTFGDVPAGGPYIPYTDVPPIWNPEYFGSTITVNGNTWPVLTVEARRYRLRVLNMCNARYLSMKIVTNPLAARPVTPALPIWVIGADGGFLPAPAQVDAASLSAAERLDLIVDFTGVPSGTQLYLINEGPNEPYGGGTIDVDYQPSDPNTVGQVMKFVVTAPTSADTTIPPASLRLPSQSRLSTASTVRTLSLNEMESTFFAGAPAMAMLGTLNADGTGNPMMWSHAITETPKANTAELWEIHNFTEDGHPVHVHQVEFEVVERQSAGGVTRPPESWETGRKDTVIALPHEITRIKPAFDIPGLYVWHCHILDHEDNEMMRPLRVVP